LNINIPNALSIKNNTKIEGENVNLITDNDLEIINFSEIHGNVDFSAPNLFVEFGSKISADAKGYKPNSCSKIFLFLLNLFYL